MTDLDVTKHLVNWADWLRRGSASGTGYPSRASGGMGNSGSKSFDAMVQEVDNRCARAVESVVSDLSPVESAAIRHFHCEAVYRFRDPAGDVYRRAKIIVGRELEKRGIV